MDRRGFYSLEEVAEEFGVDLDPSTGASMADTCDRCPASAQYRYKRGEARLTLCGHHAREHGQGLRLGGWFTYRIGELTRA